MQVHKTVADLDAERIGMRQLLEDFAANLIPAQLINWL